MFVSFNQSVSVDSLVLSTVMFDCITAPLALASGLLFVLCFFYYNPYIFAVITKRKLSSYHCFGIWKSLFEKVVRLRVV